jgi:hypothetical protein
MSISSDETSRAYERGQRDARIDNHDVMFRNLQIAQIISYALATVGFGFLALVTQRLGDKANASAATAIALAEALKIEKDTARETLALETSKSTTKWGKFQTGAAAASTVVGFLGYIYITTPHP